MSTRPRLLRQLHRQRCRSCRRQYSINNSTTVAENDIVLLRRKNDASATPILTKPLQRGGKIHSHTGVLEHDAIIGKQIRDIVETNRDKAYRIHQPTLSDYVTLTPRIVTPVYPADANLIVSLLDLHVSPPSSTTPLDAPPLEILEAGTGHGALTLHLSRAIHAANTPPPPLPSSNDGDSSEDAMKKRDPTSSDSTFPAAGSSSSSPAQTAYADWRAARRAILHTIDFSAKHSEHAARVVRGFRHGTYSHAVDFHVGDVSAWVRDELARRSSSSSSSSQHPPSPSSSSFSSEAPPQPQPFLSHILLDLPSTHTHLAALTPALMPNGALSVFNPSITQIIACVDVVRRLNLPLALETVVELGAGATGGREWDVRAVRPRAVVKAEMERNGKGDGDVAEHEDGPSSSSLSSSSSSDESASIALNDAPPASAPPTPTPNPLNDKDASYEMICRPKVGGRVVGGGFLAVWRRMRQY
ncbi:MAG: hypothetical protein M1819_004834 [Sarea resinae]|nr:MAG: hypothetical protein M1819_004834 [Sarea resinae]